MDTFAGLVVVIASMLAIVLAYAFDCIAGSRH